jgi:hypothetical protein
LATTEGNQTWNHWLLKAPNCGEVGLVRAGGAALDRWDRNFYIGALAALVAIYGVFSDPATITAHLDTLSGFLPGGANSIAPL